MFVLKILVGAVSIISFLIDALNDLTEPLVAPAYTCVDKLVVVIRRFHQTAPNRSHY